APNELGNIRIGGIWALVQRWIVRVPDLGQLLPVQVGLGVFAEMVSCPAKGGSFEPYFFDGAGGEQAARSGLRQFGDATAVAVGDAAPIDAASGSAPSGSDSAESLSVESVTAVSTFSSQATPSSSPCAWAHSFGLPPGV
ncbi:hypothetical protein CTAYLR_001240, partial [Chrysophaeum taylorii]